MFIAMYVFPLLLCVSVGWAQAITVRRDAEALSSIPTDVPNDVTILKLNVNRLSNLHRIEQYPLITDLWLIGNLFTTFPNITAIASTIRRLYLMSNQISVLDPAKLGSPSDLQYLYLGSNDLMEFPNVSAAGLCLKVLSLERNKISNINGTILNALVALESLVLTDNSALSHLPDVAGPWNTLTVLRLDGANFSHFPSLYNLGRSLTTLDLSRNVNMMEVKVTDSMLLPALKTFSIQQIPVTVLPDLEALMDTLTVLSINFETRLTRSYAAGLGQISSLHLGSETAVTIPTICPVKTETLDLLMMKKLDTCHCDMLWLKSLAVSLTVTLKVQDRLCVGPGLLWSEMSFAEMSAFCEQKITPTKGCQTSMLLQNDNQNTICPSAGKLIVVAGKLECLQHCMSEQGCQAFNYKVVSPTEGHCMLLLPSGEDNVNYGDGAGWQHYAAKEKYDDCQ